MCVGYTNNISVLDNRVTETRFFRKMKFKYICLQHCRYIVLSADSLLCRHTRSDYQETKAY